MKSKNADVMAYPRPLIPRMRVAIGFAQVDFLSLNVLIEEIPWERGTKISGRAMNVKTNASGSVKQVIKEI